MCLCVCDSESVSLVANVIYTTNKSTYSFGCISLHFCQKAENAGLVSIPDQIIKETEMKRSKWE